MAQRFVLKHFLRHGQLLITNFGCKFVAQNTWYLNKKTLVLIRQRRKSISLTNITCSFVNGLLPQSEIWSRLSRGLPSTISASPLKPFRCVWWGRSNNLSEPDVVNFESQSRSRRLLDLNWPVQILEISLINNWYIIITKVNWGYKSCLLYIKSKSEF